MDRKYPKGSRASRVTRDGYWKRPRGRTASSAAEARLEQQLLAVVIDSKDAEMPRRPLVLPSSSNRRCRNLLSISRWTSRFIHGDALSAMGIRPRGTMDPKALRDSMDARIQRERQNMDQEMQFHRVNMDKLIRAERDNLDKMIKNERQSMDTKLKEEREEMDRIIEMQRIKMEAQRMQLRMEMEAKLHEKVVLTEPYISPPPHAEVTNESQRVVMEFRVHAGGQFSFDRPRGYHGGWIGGMTFVDTAEVEWWRMVEHLACHGYKGSADLYYVHPAKVVPEGLVLMLGPEQVDELLRDHLGRKVCDLYIVNHERDDYGMVNDGSDNDEDGA